ncbi:hypothetical protein BOTBODRAFT_97552, partial [Botryobasidium botryosum FD-172 SS1]
SEKRLEDLETKLNITVRWTKHDQAYRDAENDLNIIEHQKALDHLERLMVQRLFELEKSNMRATGYKLREQIAKGLRERSEAITNALAHYNDLGKKLKPPPAELKWKEMVEISFLGDFTLLRNCRVDIREAEWANPTIRRAIVAWQETLRAKEEIIRVGVETRRLHTWIYDEE